MDFSKSQTRENLMRAFAGESQARNRYTIAACQAKDDSFIWIEAVFKYTARQELAHAELFYNFLKEEAGKNINVDGNYPVDISDNIVDLLRSAQHNEYQEYENDYAGFARIAEDEGFKKISSAFSMVSQIEKTHGDRFGKIADLMDNGKLFVSETECKWLCLKCGYVYTGKQAPQKCPVCGSDRGIFIRAELSPFVFE